MYRKMCWWAVLLSVGLAPAGGTAWAQDYAPPDPVYPFPLYNTRPEDGGFFAALGYTMYRTTNPIKGQQLAIRGFVDVDGSVTAVTQPLIGARPNTFYGSGEVALDAQQVTGPNRYTPGFQVDLGWKFGENTAITLGWLYLFNQRRTAVATLVPPGLDVGNQLQNTFLFSPVYNYPNQYAGPAREIPQGNNFALYGIWNGAEVMTIEFEQKIQRWDITWRDTIYQTECFRLNSLVGPRFFWFWERFRWRTFDEDINGGIDPTWIGVYTNIVSNRMYGAFVGLQSEYYLGHGFACMLEGQAGAYLNVVKTRVKYELGAKWMPPAHKRALTDYTFVPELEATASLMWYPIEGVQFKLGYNVMAFFNTVSMNRPVDFNYSSLTPNFTQTTVRWLDGIQASVALLF